jgi:hypothetical protein
LEQLIAGQSVDHIPEEYLDYLLCKTFHWLPSELQKQNNYTLQIFLKIMELEWQEEQRHIKKINPYNE